MVPSALPDLRGAAMQRDLKDRCCSQLRTASFKHLGYACNIDDIGHVLDGLVSDMHFSLLLPYTAAPGPIHGIHELCS